MDYPLTLAIDLDGVITDMNGSLGKIIGMDLTGVPWPKLGEYNVSTAFGISPKIVSDGMKGDAFWRELETFSWGFPLIKYLETHVGQENIIILTKPTHEGDCYKGKFEWIEKNLPKYVDQCLIGSPKQACARMNRGILIDDSDFNTEKFTKFGGTSLLLPQPWNKRHMLANQRLQVLKAELEIALDKPLPAMDF